MNERFMTFFLNLGSTNFPVTKEPSPNSGHQEVDIKQVLYRQATSVMRHCTECISPETLTHRIVHPCSKLPLLLTEIKFVLCRSSI